MIKLFTRALGPAEQSLVKLEDRPGALARPFAVVKLPDLWEPPRRLLARRALRREVARHLATAKNYQANGMPAGSKAYQQLYQQCCEAIKTYCDKWRQPLAAVAIEFPALYGLEKTAYPERAPKPSNPAIGWAFIVAVVILFLAAVLGAASGVYHLAEKAVAR